jgi:hypothetical protein
MNVFGGADGIAHVVEAIKNGDEVVAFPRELLRFGHFKRDTVGHAFTLGGFPGALDGFVMVVKTEELGIGEGFGEEDGGGAFATANVGDASPAFKLGLYVLECGDPGADKVGRITGAKEFFATVEDTVVMLVPAHTGAGAK